MLEDRNGRLIGFTWGKPHEGEFEGAYGWRDVITLLGKETQ